MFPEFDRQMPMFEINTSRDFLAKLEADFADFEKEPRPARSALNCHHSLPSPRMGLG